MPSIAKITTVFLLALTSGTLAEPPRFPAPEPLVTCLENIYHEGYQCPGAAGVRGCSENRYDLLICQAVSFNGVTTDQPSLVQHCGAASCHADPNTCVLSC
ncbi:hypothetical protein HO173_001827 [Letharia columbiana]|uniref:Uncharacterized protein n=1 Tax=Letharia columbiana TaxID=112416 RepID=A0A8H6G482_9LECA|nr:uncharacterized protein HO173_001827 [Letharia columbiana]KAF6240216.1 hypothetical protein HO173_001827 [Letharia columbiana]